MFEVDLEVSHWPAPPKELLSPVFTPVPMPPQPPVISKHYWPPPPLPVSKSTVSRFFPPSLPPPARKPTSSLLYESMPSPTRSEQEYIDLKTPRPAVVQAQTGMPMFLVEKTEGGAHLRTVSTPADLALFIKSLSSIPH
ncbi:hypothetical protein B5807_05643 [Epicoccum nigrum]|uniref:Uncharacterized protein n=1 Tax=Epicoccum nigrum TaxID=105696 RepID=A0A1Y2LZV5_EPING|nr:hypothetical protein B5807_05643 [Epicoccum nigrum]